MARLDAMEADLTRPVAQPPAHLPPSERSSTPPGGAAPTSSGPSRTSRERIRAGEAFQVVPSQRFETRARRAPWTSTGCCGPPTPSPYMYLFRFDGFDVVGSSPEALVKVEDGRAMVHPIAGTRHRGTTPQEDQALAEELLADPKERAEHLMLVDLGRNDLGRVCEPGSVEVVDFMSIERYSHVMHIVSTVTGKVAPGRTAFDVAHGVLPRGHPLRRPQAPRDADHRRTGTVPARSCTAAASAISTLPATPTPRSPSVRPLLRDGTRLRPGGRRRRRRLRPGRGGPGVPQQGGGRAAGGAHREPPRPVGRFS